MYAYASGSHGRVGGLAPQAGRYAGFQSSAASRHPPFDYVAFRLKDGRLVDDGAPQCACVPATAFEPQAAQKARREGIAVLRPVMDSAGRTVILTYLPLGRAAAAGTDTVVDEVLLVSLLHFEDRLRLAAREFGVGNLGARICRALVEDGSLRRASGRLGLSHQTATTEIRDAMQVADVHSQAELVHRIARTWLGEPLGGDRTLSLLRQTFGLTARDAAVAALRATGLTRPQCADRLGISRWAVEASSANVFARLGVGKAPELTRVVADLLLSSDLARILAADRPAT